MSDALSLQADWNYPTAVRFGAGRVADLGALCLERGITRPLVVTDKGTSSLPFTRAILDGLVQAGLQASLFDGVGGNPDGEQVAAGVDVFREGRHDGVVALGGGSGLDAGKAIALMAGQDRPLWDFEDVGDNWRRVDVAGMRPCIAIPTTAGTGSEVGRASVIIDSDRHEKKIIFHPRMMPVAVILDPELTFGLPKDLTAATGIDAFTHCFEAFCAPGFHPMADGIALNGMSEIKRWLPVAYEHGGNVEARGRMLAAATMGAVAFQKGLGAVHAMSHPVGAVYGTHHGLTNAVFLPYVMQRNRSAIEDRMTVLSSVLGLESPGFDAVFDWLIEFRARLGIPNDAKPLGVEEHHVAMLAEAAAADPSAGGNPVTLTVADYAALFKAALAGTFQAL